jgi:uncharacterized LabA/DUF88 family protein
VGSEAVPGASLVGLLLFYTLPMPRTIVYIDGFNLYYLALKHTAHKWLDVAALMSAVLHAEHHIERINYYTAHISARVDPTAPARQQAYLNALRTLPSVAIHFGRFLVTKKWAGLVEPPAFKPPVTLPTGTAPKVARVWKTEEKGSDVNLGVHLVRDAFQRSFDEAAVLTNDTDLVEAMRIVKEEAGLPITLLTPVDSPAPSLGKVSTHVRHIRPYLGRYCQMLCMGSRRILG